MLLRCTMIQKKNNNPPIPTMANDSHPNLHIWPFCYSKRHTVWTQSPRELLIWTALYQSSQLWPNLTTRTTVERHGKWSACVSPYNSNPFVALDKRECRKKRNMKYIQSPSPHTRIYEFDPTAGFEKNKQIQAQKWHPQTYCLCIYCPCLLKCMYGIFKDFFLSLKIRKKQMKWYRIETVAHINDPHPTKEFITIELCHYRSAWQSIMFTRISGFYNAKSVFVRSLRDHSYANQPWLLLW